MDDRQKPYDHKHATMLREYIAAKVAEGFTLLGVEMPYNRRPGNGFVDAVLYRSLADAPGTEWLVAEVKPSLADVGGTIRQVKIAARHFPDTYRDLLTAKNAIAIRYPLVLWASTETYAQWRQYAELLADVDIEFFHADPVVARHFAGLHEIHRAVCLARTESVR